jgi:hypothetical protein
MFPRYVPISLPRKWARDIMHFGLKSHSAGGNTIINIAPAVAARRAHSPAISHLALLVKALALVSQRRSELRLAYMPLPWSHFYLHPNAVASVVVEREWRGEKAIFVDQVQRPEEKSLAEIDREVRGMKQRPVESVGGFRRMIRITRLPLPIRRLMWHLAYSCSGRMRAKYLGTFSINSIVARRTEFMQSVTPITLSVIYGVVEPNGDMPLQFLVDHRVIDGMATRRVALDLQSVLNNEIVMELRQGSSAAEVAARRSEETVPAGSKDPIRGPIGA